MVRLRRSLISSGLRWIPLAVMTVLISLTIYAGIQHDLRTSADDPQIQMATDARIALESGASPQSLVPTTQIDIAKSLAPYLVIYDANGQPLASSATLRGQALVPPSGVFDYARSRSMDSLTWMPEEGVRSAIVVVHYAGGYVLAGRSLTQIERRESNLLLIVAALCSATLALTFLATLLSQTLTSWMVSAREAGPA